RPVLLHAARLVDTEHLERVAEVGRAAAARAAGAAHAQRLHHDPVARREARRARRLGHVGQRLVADGAAAGHAVIEMPLEDVQIGAADADAPHPQQRLVAAGLRHLRGADAEAAGALVEGRPHQPRLGGTGFLSTRSMRDSSRAATTQRSHIWLCFWLVSSRSSLSFSSGSTGPAGARSSTLTT